MVRWIVRLWPGAERFQRDGRLDGLILAAAFSLLLNLSLFSVLIWPDAFTPATQSVVCLAVVLLWIAAKPWKALSNLPKGVDTGRRDTFQATYLFQAAQREYLLGNWFQAEKLLRQVLQYLPQDVPTRLRLAALYRRTGRPGETVKELEQLKGLPGADAWQGPIRQEASRLARGTKEAA